MEFLAPWEIPEGKAKVEVKVIPVVEKQTDRRSQDRISPDQRSESTLKNADEETSPHPHSDALFAIFSQIRGDIDVDEIRSERLAKHLK